MPNRIIKESIKQSPQIDKLSWFEEVVFYRLMVTADDYGCLDGRTVLLKNQLFPTKDNVTKKAVEDAISNLVSVGLLCKYTVNDMPYLFFPTWEKHQRIRNKHCKYPQPPDRHLTANCCQMTADCQSESESNPIRIQSESESESESNPNGNPNAHADDFSGDCQGGEKEDKVFALYQDLINPAPSSACIGEIVYFREHMDDDVICFAIQKAADDNKRSWSYIKVVLQSYKADGIKTMAQVKQREADFARRKKRRGKADDETDNPFLKMLMEEGGA